MAIRWSSSLSPVTCVERKAALNNCNATPAEAMVTPGISRTSPAPRDDARTRKEWRRFSSTIRNCTSSSIARGWGRVSGAERDRTVSDLQEQFPAIHPEKNDPVGQQHGHAPQQRIEARAQELEEMFAQVDAERAL